MFKFLNFARRIVNFIKIAKIILYAICKGYEIT